MKTQNAKITISWKNRVLVAFFKKKRIKNAQTRMATAFEHGTNQNAVISEFI